MSDTFKCNIQWISKAIYFLALVEQNFFERYCESDGAIKDDSLKRGKAKKQLGFSQETSRKSMALGKCYGMDEQRYHGYCITRCVFWIHTK